MIATYQFWPPDIHENLDSQSISRVRLIARTAFTLAPAATPAPSSTANPATPAPGFGSIC